ncbi:MAG: hypothetical protein ACR2NP_09010 [Pirellulaceae bacterium]
MNPNRSLKPTLSRLAAIVTLTAALVTVTTRQTNAQHHQHFQPPTLADAVTDFQVQVRINPEPTLAVKVRYATRFPQNAYLAYAVPEGMTAQEFVAGLDRQPTLIAEYWTDPTPTSWFTVQTADTYEQALDLWYDINDETENTMEIRIVPVTVGLTQNNNMLSPITVGNNTSLSLYDYYYDYRVRFRVWYNQTAYIIETGRSSNPVIMKMFQSSADYQAYMAINPDYQLVETLLYSSGYTDWYNVLTADTLEEAGELADYIDAENALIDSNTSIQAFWNP